MFETFTHSMRFQKYNMTFGITELYFVACQEKD
jgi:hypothetical protein